MATSVILQKNNVPHRLVTSLTTTCQFNPSQNIAVVFCDYCPILIQNINVKRATTVEKNNYLALATCDLVFNDVGSPSFLHSLLACFDSGMERCTQASSVLKFRHSHTCKRFNCYSGVKTQGTHLAHTLLNSNSSMIKEKGPTDPKLIFNLNDRQRPITFENLLNTSNVVSVILVRGRGSWLSISIYSRPSI